MNIKIKNKGNGWVSGTCGDYNFEAKVYNEGSVYGINNGRVSKFTMYDEDKNWLVNYDRGWDIEPDEEIYNCYTNLIKTLENYKGVEW